VTRLFRLAAVPWLALIAASFVWNLQVTHRNALDLALTEARSTHEKDLVYRRWVAMNGGVYVTPSPETPPNPYLAQMPDRDVETTTGKRLTLINPAYMTRQVHELGRASYGTRGHITSLKPIRPENGPDAWETVALQAFAGGAKEVVSETTMDGQPFLRFMRPMRVEPSCLKCHARQGYRTGDLRGGLSVSVAMTPYLGAARAAMLPMAFGHGLFALLGLSGLWIAERRIRRSLADRDRAIGALGESEARLSSTLCSLDDLVFVLDREDCFQEFRQPGRERVLLLPPDRFRGQHFRDVLPPDQATQLARALEALKATGEAQQVDYSLGLVGQQSWWSAKVSRLDAGDGQREGTVIVARDISDRKRAEQALQARQARLDSLFRAAPVGIGLVIDRVLTEVNQTLCEMLGYRAEELLGQSSRMLYPTQEEFDAVGRDEYRQIAERGVGTVETRWQRRDGRVIDILLSSCPLVATDLSAGVTFTALDITERRRAEAALRQAQKMEAIGQLAGGVAHDFNNILTGVLMQVSLLQDEPDLSDPLRNALVELETQAQRAASLTRQLLLFGRREVMQLQPIDLNARLESSKQMLQRLIEEHITIRFEPGAGLPAIDADPGMIEQVVVNLCVNARDAMPSGGVLTIATDLVPVGEGEVRRNPHARVGPFVCLAVADTGCGMDQAVVEHIFEPFFTTKEVGKGTGLGLATVFAIVQQHRGWVDVSSVVCEGTVFRVYFPVRPEPAGAPQRVAAAAAAPGGTETILLVEDDPSVRRLFVRVLQSKGYRVIEAANGIEALGEWARLRDEIDLLLSDIVMPEGLTGLELAERLRSERPGLKVVLMSGYSADLVTKGTPGEAVVYLPKPCERELLARTLRECLDGRLAR
jgi:PAS domain S-box-containing protein